MIHINKFVDQIKAHESRGARDIGMSVKDARDLHAEITKLLLALETLRNKQTAKETDEVIRVDLTGGTF